MNKIIENLDGEIWKDVDGYEGYYLVSNCGDVISVKYHNTNKPHKLLQEKIGINGRYRG